MAVQWDASAGFTSLTAGAGAVTNKAFTIAANSSRYLIVHLAFYNASATIPNGAASVKWNTTESLALLWEVTSTGTSSAVRVQAWGLKNPTAGAFNVTVTNGSGTIAGGGCVAASYYNVHQTTPTSTPYTDATSGTGWITTDNVVGAKAVASVARAWDANTASLTHVPATSIPAYSQSGLPAPLSTGTATTVTPGKPSDLNPRGTLFLALLITKNNATHNCSTSGWTKLGQTNSGTLFTASLWYGQGPATGSLADPVFTWTGAVAYLAQVVSYKDAIGTLAALGAAGAGTTNPHTSAGANTTAAKSLAVYADGTAATTVLAAPSGWTENADSGGNNCEITFGSKGVSASGTASGAISVTGAAAAWVQRQIEIFAGPAQTSRGYALDAASNRLLVNTFEEDGAAFNTLGWSGWTAGTGTGTPCGIIALLPAPPAVNLTQTARLDNAQAFYAPTVKEKVAAPLHTNVQAFNGPTIRTTVKAVLATNGQAFYAPTVTVASLTLTVTPTRHDNAQAFYAPKIRTTVTAPLATNAQVPYAPKIRTTVKAVLATNAQVPYAPVVKARLLPALHTNAQAFFGPKLSAKLTVGARFNNAQAFFAPHLAPTLNQTARLNNAQAFSTPMQLSVRLAIPARHNNAQVFYAPRYVPAPLAQSVRHNNAQTFNTERLTVTLRQAARHDNAQTIYVPHFGPTLAVGARHNNAQTIFGAAQVTSAFKQAARFDNAQTFYASGGGWNLTGSYVLDTEYVGAHYVTPLTLAQDALGNLTGSGGSAPYTWTVNSGSITGNTFEFFATYDTLVISQHHVGTIAPDGTISGTWSDDYSGGRTGTFTTTSGAATEVSSGPKLHALYTVGARFDNAQDFYLHTVSTPATGIETPLHINVQVFYGPRLRIGLTAVRADNAQAFYGPRVAQLATITVVARFNNAQAFYGPALHVTLRPLLHTNAQAFYGASVRPIKAPPRFDNAQVFYGPKIVTRVGASARHTNAQGFFGPALRALLQQNQRGANVQTVFAPRVALRVNASARFDNAQAFPVDHLVERITAPPRFDNAQAFYPSRLVRGLRIAARFDNLQAFYAPSVGVSHVHVTVDFFPNAQTIYPPTVIGGRAPPTPTDGVRWMVENARFEFNGHARLTEFTGQARAEFRGHARLTEFTGQQRLNVFRSRVITEGELIL